MLIKLCSKYYKSSFSNNLLFKTKAFSNARSHKNIGIVHWQLSSYCFSKTDKVMKKKKEKKNALIQIKSLENYIHSNEDHSSRQDTKGVTNIATRTTILQICAPWHHQPPLPSTQLSYYTQGASSLKRLKGRFL